MDCKGVGWHDGHLQHYRLSTHRQGFLRTSSNKLFTLLIIYQKGTLHFNPRNPTPHATHACNSCGIYFHWVIL